MEDNKVTSQNAEVKPNEGVAEKSLVDLLKENPRLQSEFDKLNAKFLLFIFLFSFLFIKE